MKLKNLIFIPLVLASLVSCSSNKDYVSYKVSSSLDIIDKISYDDTSKKNPSSYSSVLSVSATDEVEAKGVNHIFHYDISYEEVSEDVYRLKRISTGEIITDEAVPMSMVSGGSLVSCTSFIKRYGDLFFYVTKDGDKYILHTISYGGIDTPTCHGDNFTVIVSSSYSYYYTYYDINFSSDEEDVSFTYAKASLYNDKVSDKIVEKKDYSVNDGTYYYQRDDDNNIIYKYTLSDGQYFVYDKNGKYIFSYSEKGLDSNIGSYTKFEYKNYVYYLLSEEYNESEVDTSSYTKYRTSGYIVDMTKGSITFNSSLPFIIGSCWATDNSDYYLCTYYTLTDGKKSDQMFMAAFNGDMSVFDGSVVYDSIIANSECDKIAKGKYIVFCYNDYSYYYVDSSHYEKLDVSYMYIFDRNHIYVNPYTGYPFFASTSKFYKEYSAKYETRMDKYEYLSGNKIYTLEKNDDGKFVNNGNVIEDNSYLDNNIAVTANAVCTLDGNELVKLKDNEVLDDFSLTSYINNFPCNEGDKFIYYYDIVIKNTDTDVTTDNYFAFTYTNEYKF